MEQDCALSWSPALALSHCDSQVWTAPQPFPVYWQSIYKHFHIMSVRHWLRAPSSLGKEVNYSVPIPWRNGQPGTVSSLNTWQLGDEVLAWNKGLEWGPTASGTHIIKRLALFKVTGLLRPRIMTLSPPQVKMDEGESGDMSFKKTMYVQFTANENHHGPVFRE